MAAASGPGIDDVLNIAYGRWQDQGDPDPEDVFGGGIADDDARTLNKMVATARGTRGTETSDRPGPFDAPRKRAPGLDAAMARMFEQPFGRRAASALGSETRTVRTIERLSVEILAQSLRMTGQAQPQDRLMVVPSEDDRPPTLLWMSPEIGDPFDTRVIEKREGLRFDTLQRAFESTAPLDSGTPEAVSFDVLRIFGTEGLAQLLHIAQPEIVKTRKPEMVPLCVPWPHMAVETAGQRSTAGMLCRDAEGKLGITACFHGTGPTGTKVQIGLRSYEVGLWDAVQDIVFIPLGDDYNIPDVAPVKDVLTDSEPPKGGHARFDGATNQEAETRIFSTDAGLLRARPSVQLKVQTRADTDPGDSGSTLIDENDQALGFAFERTGYGDFPEFTDWIWAANALRALGLTPVDTIGNK